MLRLLLMTFVFLATPAFAKPAIVVGVSDGGTLTVEWEDGSRDKGAVIRGGLPGNQNCR